MAEIGHNQPPSMIETATLTAQDLSAWLAEHPVVEDEDTAREAKLFIDRGKLCVKDLEDERNGEVRPLNEKVKAINSRYKGPRDLLDKVCSEVSRRLSAFLAEEERKRVEAAREATRIAEEAERKAREAEQDEQAAIRSASVGELGIDVATHAAQADEAFREYQQAKRKEALAERETHVKVGGGFTRALSLKSKETLHVTDPVAAIKILGKNEGVIAALLTAARAYRKIYGELPGGVAATTERKI